jgi:hypothetical protein
MEVAKGEKTFQTGVVVFPTSSRVNCRKYEFTHVFDRDGSRASGPLSPDMVDLRRATFLFFLFSPLKRCLG